MQNAQYMIMYLQRNFVRRKFPCLSKFCAADAFAIINDISIASYLRALKTRHCAWRRHVSVAIRRHEFTSLCHSGSHNIATTTRCG